MNEIYSEDRRRQSDSKKMKTNSELCLYHLEKKEFEHIEKINRLSCIIRRDRLLMTSVGRISTAGAAGPLLMMSG